MIGAAFDGYISFQSAFVTSPALFLVESFMSGGNAIPDRSFSSHLRELHRYGQLDSHILALEVGIDGRVVQRSVSDAAAHGIISVTTTFGVLGNCCQLL
jgi:hypothetical protein